ncbi:MAG: porin, partial [Alphaproteobacteria bacterium]
INADGLLQRGAELGGYYKNLYLAAEAFDYQLDRSAAGKPDASFGGWYAQAAWALTKEQRLWTPATGGFRGLRPAKPFDPATGACGAWELAARYSVLDLNDLEGAAGTALPTNGVRGGEQRITTVGLNWYPNQTVRFILDYQNAQVDRLNNAGAQVGEDFQTVSFRSQFAF